MNKLVRILAEGVMGWIYTKEFVPLTHESIANGDTQYPYFVMYEEEGVAWAIVHFEDGSVKTFSPLTNWNDCMGIVERMVKDGYDFHAHWSPNQEDGLCQGMFETPGEPTETEIFMHEEWVSQDLKKAICMATVKARGLIDD